jgi:hypothetical protein
MEISVALAQEGNPFTGGSFMCKEVEATFEGVPVKWENGRAKVKWWREEDSNLRRAVAHQVYSLAPLAARASLHLRGIANYSANLC